MIVRGKMSLAPVTWHYGFHKQCPGAEIERIQVNRRSCSAEYRRAPARSSIMHRQIDKLHDCGTTLFNIVCTWMSFYKDFIFPALSLNAVLTFYEGTFSRYQLDFAFYEAVE